MEVNNTLIKLAASYAMTLHKGQFRADGFTPYYTHPFKVAALVMEWGGSDEQVAAAYLHDVLEDTDMTAGELAALFGDEVAAIVKELTFPEDMPNRRANMLAAAAWFTKSAALVKMADATANLMDIPLSGWDRDKAMRHTRYCTDMILATMEVVNA